MLLRAAFEGLSVSAVHLIGIGRKRSLRGGNAFEVGNIKRSLPFSANVVNYVLCFCLQSSQLLSKSR